jgi:octaprenyl-diphosphate synthase
MVMNEHVPPLPPEPSLSALKAAARHGHSDRAFEAHVEALRSFLGGELERVEDELPQALAGSIEPLVATGVHLLQAGGKRIRPILTLLAAGSVGVWGPDVRRLACAGELVHLATLLHDDVIDDADTRRNRPTPRVVWSNTASVLGGDYALTRALDLVGRVPSTEPLMEAVQTLRELVEGEILQLKHRGQVTMTRPEYEDIIHRKTASLFRWCCRAGVWLGDSSHVQAFGRFGTSLGLCFQVVDDVLDFTATSAQTGKDRFADLREGKLTLPLLIALQEEPEFREELAALLKRSDDLQASTAGVLLPLLARTQALEQAREVALSHATAALFALDSVPDGAHAEALRAIAQALAGRMR